MAEALLQSELSEEVELLQQIYIDELVIDRDISGRPLTITTTLHPATGESVDKRWVCLTLQFSLPYDYPASLPTIKIFNPRGLTEEHVNSLLESLNQLAEDRHGSPVLYELIECARDSLTTRNIPHGQCMICIEDLTSGHEVPFARTDCYHYFHCQCLKRYLVHCRQEFDQQRLDNVSQASLPSSDAEPVFKAVCPVCRQPLADDLVADLEALECCGYFDDDKHQQYVPSGEMLAMQREMAALYQRQLEKGGIIDLEAERNKFLVPKEGLLISIEHLQSTGGENSSVDDVSKKDGRLDPQYKNHRGKHDQRKFYVGSILHESDKKQDRSVQMHKMTIPPDVGDTATGSVKREGGDETLVEFKFKDRQQFLHKRPTSGRNRREHARNERHVERPTGTVSSTRKMKTFDDEYAEPEERSQNSEGDVRDPKQFEKNEDTNKQSLRKYEKPMDKTYRNNSNYRLPRHEKRSNISLHDRQQFQSDQPEQVGPSDSSATCINFSESVRTEGLVTGNNSEDTNREVGYRQGDARREVGYRQEDARNEVGYRHSDSYHQRPNRNRRRWNDHQGARRADVSHDSSAPLCSANNDGDVIPAESTGGEVRPARASHRGGVHRRSGHSRRISENKADDQNGQQCETKQDALTSSPNSDKREKSLYEDAPLSSVDVHAKPVSDFTQNQNRMADRRPRKNRQRPYYKSNLVKSEKEEVGRLPGTAMEQTTSLTDTHGAKEEPQQQHEGQGHDSKLGTRPLSHNNRRGKRYDGSERQQRGSNWASETRHRGDIDRQVDRIHSAGHKKDEKTVCKVPAEATALAVPKSSTVLQSLDPNHSVAYLIGGSTQRTECDDHGLKLTQDEAKGQFQGRHTGPSAGSDNRRSSGGGKKYSSDGWFGMHSDTRPKVNDSVPIGRPPGFVVRNGPPVL